ncbi:MAG: GrpB family protein, partial [Actinomycetes bacterium]
MLLAEHDPDWPIAAGRLVAAVRAALGDRALLVEHVGSTSVPGLAAKPVIDLVLTVVDPTDEDTYVPPLEALGCHLHVREPEWHEHRMLKCPDPMVNLHVFGDGSDEVDRMLAFRDHLRTDDRDHRLYESTKRELAAREWADTQDYADAKSDVVADIMTRALAGRARLDGAFVLVTGSPGSGRTALARQLAPRLGLPLLTQDALRRTLLAELGAPDAETSG